jgi:hypothetical protein
MYDSCWDLVERFTIASRGGLRRGGRPGRGAEAGRVGGPGARQYEGRRRAGPMGRKCARQMGQRRAGCGAEACRDLGRAGMRGGGVPELGAWAHRAGPMGWRRAGPMGWRCAGLRGQRRARTRVGGGPGGWGEGWSCQWGGGGSCRWSRGVPGRWYGGVPGCGPGRWYGGVPGCASPGCPCK